MVKPHHPLTTRTIPFLEFLPKTLKWQGITQNYLSTTRCASPPRRLPVSPGGVYYSVRSQQR